MQVSQRLIPICCFNLSRSNAGKDVITQTALKFWKEGRDREEIELKDLEIRIAESVFNSNISEQITFYVWVGTQNDI